MTSFSTFGQCESLLPGHSSGNSVKIVRTIAVFTMLSSFPLSTVLTVCADGLFIGFGQVGLEKLEVIRNDQSR